MFPVCRHDLSGLRITSVLATIQPELMDGCLLRLDGMHLHRRLLAALVILLGGMYEFWRTGRVTGL
jgi:hypothetical protein